MSMNATDRRSANTPADSDNRGRQRWLLVIGAAIVLLLDGICFDHLNNALRRQMESRAVAEGARMLQVLEDRTVRLLESGDMVLRLARWHRQHDGDLASLRAELAESAFPAAEQHEVAVHLTDRDGQLIFDSNLPEPPATNIADLAYFRILRAAHEDTVVLDPTRVGRVRGVPLFRLARPILKGGRFEGAAIFTFSPDFLEGLHRQLAPDPHTEMSIFTSDRYAIARFPQAGPDFFGRPLNELNLWRQIADRDRGDYVAKSAIDGVTRHNLYRRLPKYNLVVRVGIAEQDILAGVSESWQWMAAAAAALLVALTAGGGLLFGLFGNRYHSVLAGSDRFHALFDGTRSVMLLVDPATGAITDANRAASDFYGYDTAILKRMRITDINAGLEDATLKDMASADSERRSAFLFRHRLADGGLRDVEVHSGPVEIMGRRLLFSIIFDVTERNRRDAERRRLMTAMEQSPVSIIITNTEAVIEYVNPTFTAVTGYAAEEVLGQNPRLLKSGEFATSDYVAMWADLAAGNCWRGRFHNRRKDGTLFWEEVLISPVTDETGRITHYLAIEQAVPGTAETGLPQVAP